MPRHARLHAPSVVHHVVSRFVNGDFVISDDEIRKAYLERIGHALNRSTWQLLAFAIMSSHTHLALWAGVEQLSKWILGAHAGFATWLQRRRRFGGSKARGPIFADRPTTVLVPPERVGYLVSYLHNNPVRAGVVTAAQDSTWTSHRSYLGLSSRLPFVNACRGLELCGFGDDPSGIDAFAALVDANSGLLRDPDLSASTAPAVSTSVRACVGAATQLAWPTLGYSGLRYPLVRASGAPERSPFLGAAFDVVEAAAAMTETPVARLQQRGRERKLTETRMLAILAWARLGRRPSEMATALGVSRPAVSRVLGGVPTCDAERKIEEILRQVSG